jgi:hypothetical protein
MCLALGIDKRKIINIMDAERPLWRPTAEQLEELLDRWQ